MMAMMACKSLNMHNEQQLLTEGGIAYTTIEELPPYFVEFVEPQYPVSLPLKQGLEYGGYESICAGAHIGRGYILTAAHCVAHHVMGCGIFKDLGLHVLIKDPQNSQQVKTIYRWQ